MSFKKILAMVVLASAAYTGSAMAADTSQAYINVSGNVPVFFEVWARGVPGDLDLSPNVIVNDRLLTLLHFKYNVDIATLKVKSDTASGVPTRNQSVGATASDAFAAATASYDFGAGCVTATTAVSAMDAASMARGTANYATASAMDLASIGAGVEEDCALTMSYVGATTELPLAGWYGEKITVTMVSE